MRIVNYILLIKVFYLKVEKYNLLFKKGKRLLGKNINLKLYFFNKSHKIYSSYKNKGELIWESK